MANYKQNIIISLTLLLVISNIVNCAKLHVLDDTNLHTASAHYRVRRQTHPGSTIAKLPTQDSGSFIPIVGPTQSVAPQQQSPFSQPNEFFSNREFLNSLQNAPNTLVDYLVPPSPESIGTSLNFQDPASNLENIENGFDVTSPTSSSNTFHVQPDSFSPSAADFQNQQQHHHLNNHHHQQQFIQSTPSTFANDQVQSVSFQNLPLPTSSTASLIPSSPSPTPSVSQFFSNKIFNPQNRDAFAQLSVANQSPPNQFNNAPTAPSNFPRNEAQQERPNQGRPWELGYDANEILAPPRDESFGRANEYDTINVAKLRRPPITNLNPPTNNIEPHQQPPVNLPIQPTSNQFFNQFISPPPPSQNHFGPAFNQLPPPQNIAPNKPFNIPIQNQFIPPNNQIGQNQFAPNRDNPNEQQNVVWGTQKQPVVNNNNNINPTTSAPFLPTIPPNTNPSQHHQAPNFQNVQQAPNFHNSQQPSNFQGNGFNPVPPPAPQHLQFSPPPHNNNQPIFDPNQNFPIETPLTSQFDSFLPQGTVADHTFQPFNENVRHFRKKRQMSDDEAEEQYEEEPQSNFRSRYISRPVYSFVKTDKDGHFKWSVRHLSKR